VTTALRGVFLAVMTGLDLRNFSDACRQLYAPGLASSNYPARSFGFLRHLVPSEFSGCGMLERRTRSLTIGFDTDHPAFSAAMEAYGAVMGNYAIYRFDPTVNAGRPFRRSQFFSNRRFRDLDIYQEVYVPLGIDNHCAVYVPTRPGETCFFFLERKGGPDFSDRELALLELAREQLSNALGLIRAQEAVPDDLLAPRILAARAGLTPREADVLHWLALGKSNAEIGVLLRLRLATVKGYVASIFDKLGVDNRFAAVLRARELCAGAPITDDPHFIKMTVSAATA